MGTQPGLLRPPLTRRERTSPFQCYTVWQASLNRAAGFGATRVSGCDGLWWQSPALVDYFSCQSSVTRLRHPVQPPHSARRSGASQQGSAQPPLVPSRPFAAVPQPRGWSFPETRWQYQGWMTQGPGPTLEECISPSVAILAVLS